MDTSATLSPFVFNAIQNSYIENFSLAFGQISHYAIQLFYILATLEICLFGLIWALKQQEMFGLLLFKIIKLGFVFFLITHYAAILNVFVNGLAQAGLSGGNTKIATILFSPDQLWRYGFDSSMSLLTLAVQYGTTNLGITAIYLILGFGILLMFALIACQVILLVVGFYLLSLMALLFLPFGSFTLTEKLFTRSIHGVMQSAVKIFGLIAILGIRVGIWITMNPGAFSQNTTLDKPLGLFIATLVITILCWKVPSILAASVGELGGELFSKTSGETVSPSPSFSAPSPIVNLSQVAAASNISAAASMASGMSGRTGTQTSTGSAASVNVSASTGGLSSLNQNVSELTKAVRVQKEGISRDTLNKLKASFKEVLSEKKK